MSSCRGGLEADAFFGQGRLEADVFLGRGSNGHLLEDTTAKGQMGQLAQGYRFVRPPRMTRVVTRRTALAPAHFQQLLSRGLAAGALE